MLRKAYEERIASLEDDLRSHRKMAGEFIDAKKFEALSSVHLLIEADEREVDSLKAKLDLVNDNSEFGKAYHEQTQAGDEDDW